MKIKCHNQTCQHVWEYNGKLPYTWCPLCTSKIPISKQLGGEFVENISKKKKLPGSDASQDFGETMEVSVTDSDTKTAEQIQQTQSIESVSTVLTEEAERAEKVLKEEIKKEKRNIPEDEDQKILRKKILEEINN